MENINLLYQFVLFLTPTTTVNGIYIPCQHLTQSSPRVLPASTPKSSLLCMHVIAAEQINLTLSVFLSRKGPSATLLIRTGCHVAVGLGRCAAINCAIDLAQYMRSRRRQPRHWFLLSPITNILWMSSQPRASSSNYYFTHHLAPGQHMVITGKTNCHMKRGAGGQCGWLS